MRPFLAACALGAMVSLGHVGTANAGLELLEEKVDPEVAKADMLFLAGVKAVKAAKPDRALNLFERALPKKNFASELYYNLVQVCKDLKMWDKVLLYAQGFLFLEPGTRDSLVMRDDLDRALAELGKAGHPAVAHRFDVKPLMTPVMIENVPVTSSAAIDIWLPVGKYTASATKEDWHPWKQPLVVAATTSPTPVAVNGELQPIPAVGQVLIVTSPAEGVAVYQDDVLIGTTPLAKPLELQTARKYLFRFEKPGFHMWHRYVEVYKGEVLDLKPVLEVRPQPKADVVMTEASELK